MSEWRNEVCKLNIRSELDLMFTLIEMLTAVLDLAAENKIARNAIKSSVQTILTYAVTLLNDVGMYVDSFE